MTIPQAIKHLKASGFEAAADVLKTEWQRLEGLKNQKGLGWSLGEALGDYSAGVGVSISMQLAGQIKSALNGIIQGNAIRTNRAPAVVWAELRPFWQTWCQDEDAPTYGPEAFVRNPRKWKPSLATVGTPLPAVERPDAAELQRIRAEIEARVRSAP